MIIDKSDFVSKLDTWYLFRSAGWLHEKDMLNFGFVVNKPPRLTVFDHEELKLKREKRIKDARNKTPQQTTLFDFL